MSRHPRRGHNRGRAVPTPTAHPLRLRGRGLKPRAVLVLAIATIAMGGCGESEQEKAQKQVCDARADIKQQVDQLQSLTVATATVDGVRKNVNAIQDDLKDITAAQDKLSDARRADVKAATDKFTSSVQTIVQGVASDLSLGQATTKLEGAAKELGAAYADSLGKIDCS
jgi:vacuolar-type H+-ATPase subunit E/Vma4